MNVSVCGLSLPKIDQVRNHKSLLTGAQNTRITPILRRRCFLILGLPESEVHLSGLQDTWLAAVVCPAVPNPDLKLAFNFKSLRACSFVPVHEQHSLQSQGSKNGK